MTGKTFPATAIAVYLSLNIEVIDDRHSPGFFALPLLSLTWLLTLAWFLGQKMTRAQRRIDRLAERLHLIQILAGIGWRSVAWRVGI